MRMLWRRQILSLLRGEGLRCVPVDEREGHGDVLLRRDVGRDEKIDIVQGQEKESRKMALTLTRFRSDAFFIGTRSSDGGGRRRR